MAGLQGQSCAIYGNGSTTVYTVSICVWHAWRQHGSHGNREALSLTCVWRYGGLCSVRYSYRHSYTASRLLKRVKPSSRSHPARPTPDFESIDEANECKFSANSLIISSF